MDEKQAKAVADALLAPALEAQAAINRQRAEKQRKAKTQRKLGAFAVTGFIAGGLIGYFTAGTLFPAASFGLIAGILAGFVLVKIRQYQGY